MTGGRLLWVREELALLALVAPLDQARAPTRDELLGELGRGGHLVLDRPLTSADVAAALLADPDLALQVVDGLRIARAWWTPSDSGHRFRWGIDPVDPYAALATDGDPIGHVYPPWGTSTVWRGAVCGVDLTGEWASAADAMAAVDAALTAAGWALAGQAEAEREIEDATAMDRQAERETR